MIAIWGLYSTFDELRLWDSIQASLNLWVKIGTWMTSFIRSQLDEGPLCPKERLRGAWRESFWAKKETEKEMYMVWGFSFPNPLFTSLGVKSSRAPFQNRQLKGLRRHPNPLCEVFIKLQWITPTSFYPYSPSYTTASLFILVEQKAASVSTSVKRGRQTDGFKGSRKNKSFVLFLCEGSKASNPQKSAQWPGK